MRPLSPARRDDLLNCALACGLQVTHRGVVVLTAEPFGAEIIVRKHDAFGERELARTTPDQLLTVLKNHAPYYAWRAKEITNQ